MSESLLYKLRWEIVVMVVSLILIGVVVYAIPNDYVLKLLREREQEFKANNPNSIVGDIVQGSANNTSMNP